MTLEAQIQANTEAVKALTAVIANLINTAPATAPVGAEAPKKSTKKPVKKAEPAPAPQPQPEQAPEHTPVEEPQPVDVKEAYLSAAVPPTKEEFTRAMHAVVAHKGRDALVRLLDSFGYTRVFEAPESQWASMVAAAYEIVER